MLTYKILLFENFPNITNLYAINWSITLNQEVAPPLYSVICNFSHSYTFGPKATNFSNDTSTGAKIIDYHHKIVVYK